MAFIVRSRLAIALVCVAAASAPRVSSAQVTTTCTYDDQANSHPEKLKELQELFHQECLKFGVYPMDDRSFARLNAINTGRPDIMNGRDEMVLYPGMAGMAENVFIDTLSRSIVITADLVIPKGGAKGLVLSQSGLFGG